MAMPTAPAVRTTEYVIAPAQPITRSQARPAGASAARQKYQAAAVR